MRCLCVMCATTRAESNSVQTSYICVRFFPSTVVSCHLENVVAHMVILKVLLLEY